LVIFYPFLALLFIFATPYRYKTALDMIHLASITGDLAAVANFAFVFVAHLFFYTPRTDPAVSRNPGNAARPRLQSGRCRARGRSIGYGRTPGI
jgi:hypothetical protein